MLATYKARGTAVKSTSSKTKSGCGCGNPSTCDCGVCEGLRSLSHPRHFAGQLLTEAELNGTLDYVKAKNRLHNRYLHGWGVVCGLQVACNECDGYVTVHPGYALDPCGNDILLPDVQDVPLLEMIRACRDAKRKRAAPCDPLKPAGRADCNDKEEHWCLAIRYEEQDCRPVMPLRNAPAKSCNCGCNGTKSNCGCNKSATSKTGMGQTSLAPIVCEPTRVCETYRFDVVESPDCCVPQMPRLPEFRGTGRLEGRAALSQVAPAALTLMGWLVDSLKCADFDNTLFKRVSNCLMDIGKFVLKRTGYQNVAPLAYVLAEGKGKVQYQALDIYTAQESLYQAVVQLYQQNPLNVRCTIADLLKYVPIRKAGVEMAGRDYALQSAPSTYGLLALILQYALDCVCQNLMPPCPENPCDDRVILACVTLKNDRIESICDFGCRRYAGSFPAMSYWFSAVPIVPVLTQLVKNICCSDLLKLVMPRRDAAVPKSLNFRMAAAPAGAGAAAAAAPEEAVADTPMFINQLEGLFKTLDPDGSLREALFADNMAKPSQWLSQTARRIGNLQMPDLRMRTGMDLSELREKSPALANATLKDAGVHAIMREAESLDALARLNLSAAAADQGDTVVMYTLGGRVAGFAPYDADEKLTDKQAELDSLKHDLAALRADVQSMKRAPAAVAKKAAVKRPTRPARPTRKSK